MYFELSKEDRGGLILPGRGGVAREAVVETGAEFWKIFFGVPPGKVDTFDE